MSELSRTLQNLPWGGFLVISVIIIVGFLLWAAGRRILRVSFAIIGFLFGGSAGWLLADSLGTGTSLPWIGAVAGAAGLTIGALVAYRLSVALTMLIIFAIVSPWAVITAAEAQARRAGVPLKSGEVHNPMSDPMVEWWENPERTAAREGARAATRAATQSVAEGIQRAQTAPELNEQSRAGITAAADYGKRIVAAFEDRWESTPQKMRPTLILASVVGAIVGLLIGIVMPSYSAAAVTALGGSFLWLTGLGLFALRLGMPEGPWIPHTGLLWTCLWLITSVGGLVIQWMIQKRRADNEPSS